MVAILVMLCGSATPSCYIMAKNMGGDADLSSSVIVPDDADFGIYADLLGMAAADAGTDLINQ